MCTNYVNNLFKKTLLCGLNLRRLNEVIVAVANCLNLMSENARKSLPNLFFSDVGIIILNDCNFSHQLLSDLSLGLKLLYVMGSMLFRVNKTKKYDH